MITATEPRPNPLAALIVYGRTYQWHPAGGMVQGRRQGGRKGRGRTDEALGPRFEER
jgi:hypothetical protein